MEKRGNINNLKMITTTAQAKRLGAKGGRSRSLAKRMIHIKFCTSKCPLFNNCWAKHTSHTIHEKAIEKAEKDNMPEKEIKNLKPNCALKTLPTQVIEGAKRIILDGEAGFNNEMMEQIMRLKNDLMIGNVTPRDRERYLLQLRDTKKSIYGDKSRIEGSIDKNVITADDFAEAYEISKNKKRENEQERKESDRSKLDKQTKGDKSGSEQSNQGNTN